MKRTAVITCEDFARFVGMDRDEFWETVVARLRNSQTEIIGMSFGGLVSSDDKDSLINPNKSLSLKRKSAWLKDKCLAIRAEEDKDGLKFTSRMVPQWAGYEDGDNENLTALP